MLMVSDARTKIMLVGWTPLLTQETQTVHAPATGYKGSGWGSNNGRHGVEEFLFNKWVSLR